MMAGYHRTRDNFDPAGFPPARMRLFLHLLERRILCGSEKSHLVNPVAGRNAAFMRQARSRSGSAQRRGNLFTNTLID